MIVGMDNSSVALAVEQVAKDRNGIAGREGSGYLVLPGGRLRLRRGARGRCLGRRAQGRRQSAGIDRAPFECRRFQYVSARGQGVGCQGRGAGQWRRRQDRCGEATGGVRFAAKRANIGADVVHQRRYPRPWPAGGAVYFVDDLLHLGPQRNNPGMVAKIRGAASFDAVDGPRRDLFRGRTLHQSRCHQAQPKRKRWRR